MPSKQQRWWEMSLKDYATWQNNFELSDRVHHPQSIDETFKSVILGFWYHTTDALWLERILPAEYAQKTPGQNPHHMPWLGRAEFWATPEGRGLTVWRAIEQLCAVSPHGFYFALAHDVLTDAKQEESDTDLRNTLAVQLHKQIRALQKGVGLDTFEWPLPARGCEPDWLQETEADGLLRLDHKFAQWLQDRFGEDGKARADKYLKKQRGRMSQEETPGAEDRARLWAGWFDPSNKAGFSRALYNVAWLTWEQLEAKREAERERAKQDVPFTTRSVSERLVKIQTSQGSFEFDAPDGRARIEILDRDGQEIGRFVSGPRGENIIARVHTVRGSTIEAIVRGSELLSTVPGHKLIRAMVQRTHANVRVHAERMQDKIIAAGKNPDEARAIAEQARNDILEGGVADVGRVSFPGGYTGLCEVVGMNTKYASKMKLIVAAGRALDYVTPEFHIGGLWTIAEYKRGGGGQGGVLILQSGMPLFPRFGYFMPDSIGQGARFRIPELRHDPPVGKLNPKQHGAAWNLAKLIMMELVDLAPKILRAGLAPIPPSRWERLSRVAGIHTPESLAKWQRAALEGDSDKAPQFLVRDGNGWTLAQPYSAELDFILDGAKVRKDKNTTKRTDHINNTKRKKRKS